MTQEVPPSSAGMVRCRFGVLRAGGTERFGASSASLSLRHVSSNWRSKPRVGVFQGSIPRRCSDGGGWKDHD